MMGNYTAKEWLKMGNSFTPAQVEEVIEGYENEIKTLNSDNENEIKSHETIDEQLFFAKRALEEIVEAMGNTNNCRELKSTINDIIEVSHIEF